MDTYGQKLDYKKYKEKWEKLKRKHDGETENK
jgi:hypothetical protein